MNIDLGGDIDKDGGTPEEVPDRTAWAGASVAITLCVCVTAIILVLLLR